MSLLESIKKFKPLNQQEACDKERMIAYMAKNENCLSRENDTAHFTASMWTVNRERTKTLTVSYTHLRAHETQDNLVCRLLLEKNFFNDTATTEIYTMAVVGSVRCV